MRRADRLFQIVHLLQTRRTITAGALAAELGVSVRTVYRDVVDLVDRGVPIEGEAGVGYRLAKGFQLPPLTFDREEVEALVVGARMASSFADPALGEAARRALVKIEAVIPPPLRAVLLSTPVFAPRPVHSDVSERLEPLRAAVGARRKVRLDYTRGDGAPSTRVVRPVCLYFWGASWSVGAWCELRETWRNFRVDRIVALTPLEEPFDDPQTTLEAWVHHLEREAKGHIVRFGERHPS